MGYGDGYDDDERAARKLPAQPRTRTRLPDDPHEVSGRQPASPRRSLVTVLGVVMLLLGAIVVANQADDGGGGGSGGGSSERAGGQGDAARPTAPSGQQPVERAANGIPAGFSQNEDGAASAAANYAVALGGVEMFDPERREAVVAAVFAPDAVAEQEAALAERYSDPDFLTGIGLTEDGTAPEGMTFVSRVLPAGTRVVDYDGETARVEVWYSALFGLAGEESTNPVTESWYTGTYDLVWTGGDWKVAGYSEREGPVPVARDQRASAADEMAEAVEEFGGFTYAR